MSNVLNDSETIEAKFLRAIATGAAVGIPLTLAALTIGGVMFAEVSWTVAAGFAALPAVFCGPFFVGLFTTSAVELEDERPRPEHETEDALEAESTLAV